MPTDSIYFLVSCARSGSTSLTTILNEATNGCCLSEPIPNLSVECRRHHEGLLKNPGRIIDENLLPRVRNHLTKNRVYGEKNVTLGFFIPEIYSAMNSKFVLLLRDGRDVVRSLVDWHNQKFGTIYRECRDPGTLNSEALISAGRLPVHMDSSDYARPRPLPGTDLHAEWEHLSRQEMCAYYWSTVNEVMLNHLEALPASSWVSLDYTSSNAESVLRVARFCGLQGLSEERVGELLGKKINSLKDRGVENKNPCPDWRHWDSGERRRFTRIAGPTMKRLGYFKCSRTDWKPAGYGKFWQQQGGGYDWYLWMHNYRKLIHEDFFRWVAERDGASDSIESIADLGCGMGIGYCEQFTAKRYIGVDLAEKNVEWCRANRANQNHAYHAFDFLETPLVPQADVVTASGTIDNCYDVEVFLDSMLASARKWIYLTCYRGWFPELQEHQYHWNPEHGCFYNDISPHRVREFLQARGCTSIIVDRLRTGRSDIPYETRIIAKQP